MLFLAAIQRKFYLLLTFSLMSVSAISAPVDDLTNQARHLLEAGDGKAALIAATKAVVISPNHYKGYYYVAMAKLALNDLPGAQLAVTKSLNVAPESAKAGVEKLVDAISSQMKVDTQIKDSVIFLSCSGELVREFARSYGEKTHPFKNIYRINLSATGFAVWKDGVWEDIACTPPEKPKEGYIDWSHKRYCSITGNEFSWGSISKETDDSGKPMDRSMQMKISRTTGILEFQYHWSPEIAGQRDGYSDKAKAECISTDEPKALSPGPVKF